MFCPSLIVAALVLLGVPAHAGGGILIVEKTTTGGTTHTSQVQIEGSRMRAEMVTPSGEKQAIVFDGTKQVMWIVNYDKKTHSEMRQADIDRLSGQMGAAMAQMREQMKNVPPEQRAMVEKMMQGRGMAGPGASQAHKTE